MYAAAAAVAKSLQLCPTLCDPIDGSPLGSSVPGILQARILEWVAISSSRGSFQPKDQTHISYVSCIADRFFTAELPGKPTVKPDNGMNEYSDTAPGFQFVEGIS